MVTNMDTCLIKFNEIGGLVSLSTLLHKNINIQIVAVKITITENTISL